MKKTVYTCPFTAKTFPLQEKESYVVHLATLRDNMRRTRRYTQAMRAYPEWYANIKENTKDVKDIVDIIQTNQRFLMDAVNGIYDQEVFFDSDKLSYLVSKSVFNKHVGYVKRPEGGAGFDMNFQGRFIREARYNHRISFGEVFHLLDIKKKWRDLESNWTLEYEGYIYLSDWTGIRRDIEEREMINKIMGK